MGSLYWGIVYIFDSILSHQTFSLKTANLMCSVLFKWIWFIIFSLLSVSYDCLHFKQVYCIPRGQFELESHVCRVHVWNNNNQYSRYNCKCKGIFGNWKSIYFRVKCRRQMCVLFVAYFTSYCRLSLVCVAWIHFSWKRCLFWSSKESLYDLSEVSDSLQQLQSNLLH
jgi:hypothetical protein